MCKYKIIGQSFDSTNISFQTEISQITPEYEIQRNPNQLIVNIDDNFESELVNNNNILQIKTGLQNPTEKYPVNITEFLGKNLDINFLLKHLKSQYVI